MARNKPVETPLPAQASSEAASKSHVIGTIFESSSRAAATYTSDELKNFEHPGVRLFINRTNVGGAGTVTAKIQVKDPVSGQWVDLTGAVTTALATVACSTLTLYPGLTAAANDKIDGHLGVTWRVSVTVAANAVVFSISGEYLV
jgi:hypothetical protein